MATEIHKHAGRKSSRLMNAVEMDKELADIQREMEELEMKMQQSKKQRWVHEWPMKAPKVKWPVRELMVKRQRKLLKKWLRYVEGLRTTEDKMISYGWPETGRSLDDWDDDGESELGSNDDLKYCRLGRKEEIPNCQEGNRLRSAGDLKDCHEDSEGILHCQLGNDHRSLWDLKNCQEDSRSMSNCQVGKDEKLRLSESLMDSGKSSI
jgi:hypothetical protein